jgi:nucleotide-binding universal stress UspA family protein
MRAELKAGGFTQEEGLDMSGIVAGVDGSDHSKDALDWAITEAAVRQVPLTVLAVSPVAANIFGYTPERYPADEEARSRVEKATQQVADEAVARRSDVSGLQVTVQTVSGLPADELIKASQDADLLVVGARGAGGFARLVMGSVSSQVVHHALCPVVVVPGSRRN